MFPHLRAQYLYVNLLFQTPMRGLWSRPDVSHKEADVHMAVRDHRERLRGLPAYVESLNVALCHKRMPVVILACERADESIVYCIGLNGELTRAPHKEFGSEWAPLLQRALVIGGGDGDGPIQLAGEDDGQYASIAGGGTIELSQAMSEHARRGVREIVRHSLALGAHLNTQGSRRMAMWDYLFLYGGRDSSLRLVRIRDVHRRDREEDDDELGQVQVFLGMRGGGRCPRSTRLKLRDGTEFCAVKPQTNGMFFSVSNRENSIACALQLSFFVYRVITGGEPVGGDDLRIAAEVCSPVCLTEALASCMEQLSLLHDPSFLEHLFGSSKKGPAAVVAKAQTVKGLDALRKYLAKSPALRLPTHAQYFAALMGISHPENAQVMVLLAQAKLSVPVKVSSAEEEGLLQRGTDDLVRLRDEDGTDVSDDAVAAGLISRLSCATVADLAWKDPYVLNTQMFLREPPPQVTAADGAVIRAQQNVDALQMLIPLSQMFREGSDPPELVWPFRFRGLGESGGPPFEAVPRAEHDGVSDEAFEEFWRRAKIEIESPRKGAHPDYVSQMFPDVRYLHTYIVFLSKIHTSAR